MSVLQRSDTRAADPALASAGGGPVGAAGGMPAWLPAVALSTALAVGLLVWDPHVRDLAAQTFRAELFERDGFVLWNGSWYQGHYTLTYSVLFPPFAALIGPQLVGALSAVASAYLFDRIVREHWGERARWATLWYAAGAVTMLANGNITFALGIAFGLASLRALQRRRGKLAVAAAAGCALSSPVAAVSLGGVAGVAMALRRGAVNRAALAVAGVAVGPVLLLNVVFPEQTQQPFSFQSFATVPVWCIGAIYLTRDTGERRFHHTVLAYLVATTLVWLIPNPLGDNAIRLVSLFGGPVLLAILLAHRQRLPVLLAALVLLTGAYWQGVAAVRELVQSAGDDSTQASYYEPLAQWLRDHGGKSARIEVPPTLNSWESAYLAPDFQLARGWLRQLDRTRSSIFYEGHLSNQRYREWLQRNGVRYVALADAPIHDFAADERKLILREPNYLEPAWISEDWRVYEVADPRPLVHGIYGARAELVSMTTDSFTLRVERPGALRVLVRGSPYWEMAQRHDGCVGKYGKWTMVRTYRPGRVRVEVSFSLPSAWRSAAGQPDTC
jgi:hypothetical protein